MKKVFTLLVLLFFYYFSFSQGVWTQKASFPGTARYDAMSFEVGTIGFVVGGSTWPVSILQDMWEYDAVSNIWTQKQNFISTRWMGVSFSIGGKGYLGTGQGAGGYKNDFWEYDPISDSWTQKANLPAPVRAAGTGFSINGKGYAGLGFDGNTGQRHKDWWEYDPLSNTWLQKADFAGGKRNFATGFSLLGKGYIGTGRDSTTIPLEDFWEYNPVTDAWTQKPNFPGGKRADIDGAHFIIGNYGYIGMGWNQSTTTYYNDFWKYSPANDTWNSIQNFPVASRMGMSSFSINNKGYVGLGVVINSTAYNDLWEYTDTTGGEGVNEINLDNYFSVYPNPTTGKINVQCTNNIKYKNIEVINVLGEKVYRLDAHTNHTSTIDLSSSPDGIYFVRVNTEKGIVSKKVVVMR